MATSQLWPTVGARLLIEIGTVAEIELLAKLGEGATGHVWQVAEVATGQHYALKIIRPIFDASRVPTARIHLEADVRIPSAHVVQSFGLRQWDQDTFLILMEYFHSTPLNKLLQARTLNGEQKRTIFHEILLGVLAAHRSNVIHRDLKPGNVLVGQDGHAKLIDFGFSKFKKAEITMYGYVLGTPGYVAPEMYSSGSSGSKMADARVDIYALGHILYEIAMEEHFWRRRGWSKHNDFIRYLTQEPRPVEAIDLNDFHCDFYPMAREVLARMVKVAPEKRYQSVDEALTDLGHVPPTESPEVFLSCSPWLIVETGSNRAARLPLTLADGASAKLGRADIAGNDESISREHLEFRRQGERYFVRDLGSKNGTLLRGGALVPHAAPVAINHGDRIKVGDIFLRFECARAD